MMINTAHAYLGTTKVDEQVRLAAGHWPAGTQSTEHMAADQAPRLLYMLLDHYIYA